MERNKIKIVSNKSLKMVSYYIQNEDLEWIPVDKSSPLSRKEYIEISLKDNAEKVIRTIDEIYNVGDRGVDIQFEGSDDEYTNICSVTSRNGSIVNISGENCKQEKGEFPKNISADHHVTNNVLEKKAGDTNVDMNISFEHKKSQLIVAGKIKSGKTVFIEEFCKFSNIRYSKRETNEYMQYTSADGNTTWYELKGIDLGKEHITAYEKTLEKIVSETMTVYIYCISTSKIESTEEKMIMDFKSKHPGVKILIVLTSYIEDDALLVAEQISKQVNGVRVIPILAREKKTRQGIIPSFGLDSVSQYIYGGR